jgi:hypothetical protein
MKDKSSTLNLFRMSVTSIIKEKMVFLGDKISLPAFKRSTPNVMVSLSHVA